MSDLYRVNIFALTPLRVQLARWERFADTHEEAVESAKKAARHEYPEHDSHALLVEAVKLP